MKLFQVGREEFLNITVFYTTNHRRGFLLSMDAQWKQILAIYLCLPQSEQPLLSANVFVVVSPLSTFLPSYRL